MATIKEYINRFMKWCEEQEKEVASYKNNPNKQNCHLLPSETARKKAIKEINKYLLGKGVNIRIHL